MLISGEGYQTNTTKIKPSGILMIPQYLHLQFDFLYMYEPIE